MGFPRDCGVEMGAAADGLEAQKVEIADVARHYNEMDGIEF